jgi:D-alanyl-D-alanine carboxypeptidase (penicillin-binding protein 5/6)
VRRSGRPSPVALLVALALLPFGLAEDGIAPSAIAAPASGPPPTPVVRPGGGTSPSPFPQVLRTPEPSAEPPQVQAPAAVLADLDSGQILFAKDPDAERPIASLTKIMTAYLVLMRSSSTDVVTVGADAAGGGRVPGVSEVGLEAGERIAVGQLLYALLLQSANDAAVALADHVAGSVEAFVKLMNHRAAGLGMRHTRFASPNGLDDAGYSSARDLVTLTRAAWRVPSFGSITATRFHTIPAPKGEPSRAVQNRNVLLWLYPGSTGVKTGFTTAAGYCVVASAERDGLRLVAVVLGDAGEPFSDAAALLSYGFTAFERRDVLAEGRSLGTVDVAGRTVDVAAGAGVAEALVPAGARVTRTIVVRRHVAFPPPRGERIGTVRLSARGVELPSVPLVVTAVPSPPPPDPGPWWVRAGAAVARAVRTVLQAVLS